jgi:hypothetical protein
MPQRVSGTRGGGLFNAVERSRFSPKAKEGKRDTFFPLQKRCGCPGFPE